MEFRSISKAECQQELLKISCIFHQICVKEAIPYFMIGGTMLGAIRHKGFIPWDDDIDFAFDREYYDKIINILEKELPYPYKLVSFKNVDYPFEYLKIENTLSIISDPLREGVESVKQGISVDLFPLDECSSNVEKLMPVVNKKHMWDRKILALYYNMSSFSLIKRIIQKVMKVLWGRKDKSYWMSQYYIMLEELHQTGSEALINFASSYHEKDVYKKEVWGTPRLYQFEGYQFYGVEKYDEYLSHLFGNYMELPPMKDRESHGNNYYLYE